MWKVRYKQHNETQAWMTLDSYSKKSQALIHAARASGEYYSITVTDDKGEVIWTNNNQNSKVKL